MKNSIFIFLFAAFTAFILYNGCKDTITNSDINKVVIPDSNVSYSKYIQPLFNVKCTSCHGNGTTDGGVTLTSCSQATADPSIVFPGEPENSILVWAIEGNPATSPMPPIGYPTLNQNQIQGVKVWIKEGAQCN